MSEEASLGRLKQSLIETFGNDSSDEYSKLLLNSIMAELETNGSQLQTVYKFIADAINNTEQQRQQINLRMNIELAYLEEKIQQYQELLRSFEFKLSLKQQEILSLIKEINQLKHQVSAKKTELQNLSLRQDDLQKAFEIDEKTFSSRNARDERSLKALEKIIPQILSHKGQMSFLQERTLQMFLETGKSLNPEQIKAILQKLTNIQQAITKSKEEDERKREANKNKFDALMQEMEKNRVIKSRKYSILINTFNQKNNQKQQSSAEVVNYQKQVQQTTKTLNKNVQIKETTLQGYQNRLKYVQNAEESLRAAYNILKSNNALLNNREQNANELAKNL